MAHMDYGGHAMSQGKDILETQLVLVSHYHSNIKIKIRLLAQKCLKPCVNGVLKFQLFFLNLFSKFPAGVRVRTSKYPYMDMCDSFWLGLAKWDSLQQ